jgi:predicted DNA-binding protein (UPF0251 family)
MDDPKQTPLWHGYTYADLDEITRAALARDRWRHGYSDRYDAVWHAIAEHLATATTRPDSYALIGVGMRASDAQVRDEMRTHGRDPQAAGRAMPRWHQYWNPAAAGPCDDDAVDRLAVEQIWPLLAPRQRQVLMVLAETGDLRAAAVKLGISEKAVASRAAEARQRFLQWWHEGEAPSRFWRSSHAAQRDGMCRGQQRLTVSQVDALRARRLAGETVAALSAEAGVSRATLSRLLLGSSRPAPDPIEPLAA